MLAKKEFEILIADKNIVGINNSNYKYMEQIKKTNENTTL